MRHLVKKAKLNKDKSHREAMLRTLAAQIIQYEHVDTTGAKAQAVIPYIDKAINMGKEENLVNATRKLHALLYDELAIKKVLDVLSKKYKDKKSGFVSIVKIGKRQGDNAEIVRIRLVD